MARVLVRLPNLVTLLFSLTLVAGFKLLNDRFHWSSAPSFSLSEWNDVLVLLSFLSTLLFIFTAWLGFNILIEQVPYKDSFNRFLFDAARFSAVFPILMWSFLAENPTHFQVFTFGLASWHLAMALWFVWPRLLGRTHRSGHSNDLYSHVTASVVYLALGLVYYQFVAKDWATEPNETLRIGLVLGVLIFLISWSVNRLIILQKRLLAEAVEADLPTVQGLKPKAMKSEIN